MQWFLYNRERTRTVACKMILLQVKRSEKQYLEIIEILKWPIHFTWMIFYQSVCCIPWIMQQYQDCWRIQLPANVNQCRYLFQLVQYQDFIIPTKLNICMLCMQRYEFHTTLHKLWVSLNNCPFLYFMRLILCKLPLPWYQTLLMQISSWVNIYLFPMMPHM